MRRRCPRRRSRPLTPSSTLGTALHLLSEHHIKVPATVGPLDVRTALVAGMAVEIANGRRLSLATVEPDSPLARQPIKVAFPLKDGAETEVILVFRAKRAVWPDPELVLQPGDQVMIITTSGAPGRLVVTSATS